MLRGFKGTSENTQIPGHFLRHVDKSPGYFEDFPVMNDLGDKLPVQGPY